MTLDPDTEQLVRRRMRDRGVSFKHCLLYTSDAADERSSVALGGRRIIKKKNIVQLAQPHKT